jgi:hypothetical protein
VNYAKTTYFRSKKHLQNVASLDCQICGSGSQVQAAHSNQSKHGKGRGIKASDQFTAATCQPCHTRIDSGSDLTKQERIDLWDAAHVKTVKLLIHQGVWPEGVNVPIDV